MAMTHALINFSLSPHLGLRSKGMVGSRKVSVCSVGECNMCRCMHVLVGVHVHIHMGVIVCVRVRTHVHVCMCTSAHSCGWMANGMASS